MKGITMQLSTQHRIALFLVSLFAAAVLSSIPLYSADETGYTIRAKVNEVRLAFFAADRQGHAITSLRSSDVAVADNGMIVRQFRSFRPASESPLELVILFDASDSVAPQIPTEIAEVKNFVEHTVWGEKDKVSILAFGGSRAQLICARNCNGEAARVRLNTLGASGATPLYDALLQAAEVLQGSLSPEARPAMVLFSDGVDTISMHSARDALQAAQMLQAAIYSVNSRSRKAGSEQGDAILDYLARSTGGLSFAPGQNVAAALHRILEDLRGGYVLTYVPPERSAGQHSIRILPTSDPRLQFRSRQAYDDKGDE
jgi:VWFA-related protein